MSISSAEAWTENVGEGRVRTVAKVRTVNRPMGPGFVVQQQEEVKSNQKCKTEATTLHMNIEKGMRDGDSITFEMMGEQRPKQIPGDVVFKLKLQKHKVFTRRGNDLTIKDKITLRQALLGFEKKIKHLDGHEVLIRREGVTMPGAVMKVPTMIQEFGILTIGERRHWQDAPTNSLVLAGLYTIYHLSSSCTFLIAS